MTAEVVWIGVGKATEVVNLSVRPVDRRDVILDSAVGEIERALSRRLGAVDRIDVVNAVRHACEHWAWHQERGDW